MSKVALITTGVGTEVPAGVAEFSYEDLLCWLEKYCVSPELYQDIRLALDKNYKECTRFNSGQRRPPVFRVSIGDAHRTLVIDGHESYVFRGRFSYYNYPRAKTLLSVTDDGLINDIFSEPPNMNPGNLRLLFTRQV